MHFKKILRIAAITLASLAVLAGVLLIILFLISGGFMKQTYLDPWRKDYAQQYDDPRVRLVARGLLAANGHNMQPWKIKLDQTDQTSFYLYADSSRLTKEVDPYARQFMITQGAFLEYVAVAGIHDGWSAQIDLFPNGDYNENDLTASLDTLPVAKVTLVRANPQHTPLYDGIYLPDTNRGVYTADTLSPAQLKTLQATNDFDNMNLVFYQDKANLAAIGDYAVKSATVEAGVGRVMEESNQIFRANEYEKNKYRSGYSVEGQGASGLMKTVLQGLITIFPSLNGGAAASRNFITYTRASVDATPAYAMIITPDNTRRSQVESGRLYSRLVLAAHAQGLAIQPLSQVLEEYPEMSTLYTRFKQTYAPHNGTVQMLVRIGRPLKDVPVSMRRDVMDIMIK